MSLSSQDYADISDDVYKDRAVGRRAPGKEELVAINGHEYKILEHVDNRLNGYQERSTSESTPMKLSSHIAAPNRSPAMRS
ncbi:hypothetical protein AA979_10580 [Stenotrophomonas maltophilia]|nr:hypothetical protein AA979_10580 [Stenotrophomonas maltophilia]